MRTSGRVTRNLTAKTEAWLRERVPGWGEMRDRAVAAGLVDPAMPASEEQIASIKEIRRRVERRLQEG